MNTIKELNPAQKDDMQNIQKELNKLLKELKDTKDSLYSVLTETKIFTKNVVQDSIENLKSKSASAQESVTEYVQKNPLKTLGLALIAGVITSKLISK